MKNKVLISAVIICKNEEHNIRRCLESVNWADEIVVYDTGSNDNTIDICREYGCSIHQSANWEGFGKAKHTAVNLAKHDWIFSIDADEEVSENLKNKIISILNNQNSLTAYRVKRLSFFLGQKIRYSGWQRDYTLKLFNRKNGNFNLKTVHEYVEVDCEIKLLKEVLFHHTYPDIRTHINKMILYSELSAQKSFKMQKRTNICLAVLKGLCKFLKMYIINFGFLDGKKGLVLALNSVIYVYLKNIYLWEKNQK